MLGFCSPNNFTMFISFICWRNFSFYQKESKKPFRKANFFFSFYFFFKLIFSLSFFILETFDFILLPSLRPDYSIKWRSIFTLYLTFKIISICYYLWIRKRLHIYFNATIRQKKNCNINYIFLYQTWKKKMFHYFIHFHLLLSVK